MNLDLNALALLFVAGVIGLGAKLLLGRLDKTEATLTRHGNKLIRIETRLGIPDYGNGNGNGNGGNGNG